MGFFPNLIMLDFVTELYVHTKLKQIDLELIVPFAREQSGFVIDGPLTNWHHPDVVLVPQSLS